MVHFRYIPLAYCGRILDSLQDSHFDDIKKTYKVSKLIEPFEQIPCSRILTGLFILKNNDNTLLSIAIVVVSKLDRIYTFPSQRNKGYAQKLLHEIVTFGIKNNILYYSPVEERVKELFIKENWIPISNNINKDLTIDYCHRLFYDKIKKTNNEITTLFNMDMFDAFHRIINNTISFIPA